MNRTSFRAFAVLPPLIFIVLTLLPRPSMPHVAELYYEWWLARPFYAIDKFQYYGTFVLAALLFISSAGVILFRRWARPLYLVTATVLLLVEIPQAPMLIWGSVALLNNIATLAMGAVLAVLFSPLGRQWFE